MAPANGQLRPTMGHDDEWTVLRPASPVMSTMSLTDGLVLCDGNHFFAATINVVRMRIKVRSYGLRWKCVPACNDAENNKAVKVQEQKCSYQMVGFTKTIS